MTREEIITVHEQIDRDKPQSFITAANTIIANAGGKKRVDSINKAVAILQTVLHSLLDANLYTEAALLCWGTTLFDPRPISVRLIWKPLMTKSKMVVLGAGSCGKFFPDHLIVQAFDRLSRCRSEPGMASRWRSAKPPPKASMAPVTLPCPRPVSVY